MKFTKLKKLAKNPTSYLIFLLAGAFLYNYVFHTLFPPSDEFFNYEIGKMYLANPMVLFDWTLLSSKLSWWAASVMHVPYYPSQWLYQVFIFGVIEYFGLTVKHLIFAAMATGVYLAMYLYVVQLTKKKWFSVIFISVLVLAASSTSMFLGLVERPQSIVILLFVCTILLLEKGKWVWTLPLYVLAVNIHGGLYPVMLVPYVIYAIKNKQIRIFIIPLLLTMANPLGFNMFTIPLSFSGNSNIGKMLVAEWNSILQAKEFFGDYTTLIIWGCSFMIFLIVAFRKINNRRELIFKIFLAIIWLSPLILLRYLYPVMLFIPLLIAEDYWSLINSTASEIPSINKYGYLFLMLFSSVCVIVFYANPIWNILDRPAAFYNVKTMTTIPNATEFVSNDVLDCIKANAFTEVLNVSIKDGSWMFYNHVQPAITWYDTSFAKNNTATTEYEIGVFGTDVQKLAFLSRYDMKYVAVPYSANEKNDKYTLAYMKTIESNQDKFVLVFTSKKRGVIYKYVH